MATPYGAQERANEGRSEPRREASRSIVDLLDRRAVGFAVTNISAHGIAGRCGRDLVVGQPACFLFENGERCLGQVRRRRDDGVGIYSACALSAAIMAGSVRGCTVGVAGVEPSQPVDLALCEELGQRRSVGGSRGGVIVSPV